MARRVGIVGVGIMGTAMMRNLVRDGFEVAHPMIIGGSPEEEAQQALMMGPTARLIEEKKPAELTRQMIAREIEAAFAAEAKSGPIRLPATIFVVAARRPVSTR
jgi:predicted dinucleotide-binding enzyme